MKRAIFILAAFLALAAPAVAQFTQVSGTVTDPMGVPYANGTVSMRLVPTGTAPTITATGMQFSAQSAAALDANGSFLAQLADNALVTPAATRWVFTVCTNPGVPPPWGFGSVCFTSAPVLITGASQSVSATLSALATVLVRDGRARYLTPLAADPATCTPARGEVYYNTGTSLPRYCSGLNTWANFAGGGGVPGGLDTQVQFNDGGAFGGSAGLTYIKATGILTATGFSGPLTGNVTGNVSGTAATITTAPGASTELMYRNAGPLGATTSVTYDPTLQMLSMYALQLSETTVTGAPAAGLHWLSIDATSKKLVCTDPASTSCLAAPFANVTAGTNATALVVGTGGSLGVSGTGTILGFTAKTGSGTEALGCTTGSLAAGDAFTYDGSKCVNSYIGISTNPQAGAIYAIVAGDKGKLVLRTHTTTMADTIAQAGSAGFPNTWYSDIKNNDTADAYTLTATTSKICVDSACASSVLALGPGDEVHLVSNATDYIATVKRAVPARTTGTTNFLREDYTFAAPSGSGTVNSGTAGQLAYYATTTNAVSGNTLANISNGALTLGLANTTLGTLTLQGNTSGALIITPQAAAGTPTWTAGTSSGTPAVTASAPLGITTATGNATCATCVTSAASLTSNAVVIGGGSQASSTISASTTTTQALFATATAPAFRAIVAGDLPLFTSYAYLDGGICQNATAGTSWDLPVSTPAVATCVTGTNIQKGVLAYADTTGGFSAQYTMALPAAWSTSTLPDVDIYWTTTATTGNVKWTVALVCTDVAASATDDPAFPTTGNGFNTVTTAAPGTGSRVQTSTITSATVPSSCVTGTKELLHIRLFRDGNDASDTIAATANVIGMMLSVRRVQ